MLEAKAFLPALKSLICCLNASLSFFRDIASAQISNILQIYLLPSNYQTILDFIDAYISLSDVWLS